MQAITGTIAKLTDRGFGFITPDDPSLGDCFFLYKALVNRSFDELRPNDRVSFKLAAQSDRGLRAKAVEVLE